MNQTSNLCMLINIWKHNTTHEYTRLSGKFAANSYLHIPPHFKYIATLPCKIWMSENWQSEICIVINDTSSIAKHLSCDASLHCKYIIQFAGERIFTRSSAIAEGPRDASCQLKSCQLPRNSAETILVRQGLNKSKLWSWRVTVGQCVINMCTQPRRDQVAFIVL